MTEEEMKALRVQLALEEFTGYFDNALLQQRERWVSGQCITTWPRDRMLCNWVDDEVLGDPQL